MVVRRKPHKSQGGLWEFPGGKVEPCESYLACLKRELLEELSLPVEDLRFFAESYFDYPTLSIRLLAYLGRSKTRDVVLSDHDRICWLDIEQLGDLSWSPADVPIVQKLLDSTPTILASL